MSGRPRLGVVLRLREMAEEKARVDLARALAAEHAATGELERLLRIAEDERRAFPVAAGLADEPGSAAARPAPVPAVSAADLNEALHGFEIAARQVADARARLLTATADVTVARGALAHATRAREVVERLRDRLHALERAETERAETSFMAELATVSYVRRTGEEAVR